jgi:hypothetical protein
LSPTTLISPTLHTVDLATRQPAPGICTPRTSRTPHTNTTHHFPHALCPETVVPKPQQLGSSPPQPALSHSRDASFATSNELFRSLCQSSCLTLPRSLSPCNAPLPAASSPWYRTQPLREFRSERFTGFAHCPPFILTSR